MAAKKTTRVIGDPFDVVRRLRHLTGHIAVGVSCGKDSVVTYDLCLRWFPKVTAFYMYCTPGLAMHEQYLTFLRDRAGSKLYPSEIIRLPHWSLSRDLRNAICRDYGPSQDVEELSIKDIEVEVARQTGALWFAYGMKKADSLERRGMLTKDDGIILASHRGFPLAEWSNRSVTQYMRNNRIPLSPEYPYLGTSYGGHLDGAKLSAIKQHFPGDYAKIIRRFPYAEADVFRFESGMKGDGEKNRKRQA